MERNTETAILAGGCFWGVQDLIRKTTGVVSSRVGYTGGDVDKATYRDHGTHAEAIENMFDPAVVSIRDIDRSGIWPGKVVTTVTPAGPFWEAEPEHQDYLLRRPHGYTYHFVRPNWRLPGTA